jgi:beta-N-acetylhexosaminidase
MAQLRLLARILGAELQASGFNTLFGPVLDLTTPGSILRGRTLAASPAATTRAGNAFIEEVSTTGIVVCGKHFPGLGGVTRDPHFSLPHINKSKKLLLMEDIPPFANLFHVLPMIMVGHAHYPSLSESRPLPACLSPQIVQRLLRKKLRYSGVIITDDMTQGAVTSIGLTPDRFMDALDAGNDMILFSQTTPLVEQAFQTIVRSAKQSAALQNRITDSVERILDIKRGLPLPVRHRANARTRILRHIDKLSRTAAVTAERVGLAG